MNSSCILLFGVGAGCAGGTAENALAGNVRIAAVEPGVHWLGAPDRYIADAPLHPPVEAVEKLTTPDEYLGANALIFYAGLFYAACIYWIFQYPKKVRDGDVQYLLQRRFPKSDLTPS